MQKLIITLTLFSFVACQQPQVGGDLVEQGLVQDEFSELLEIEEVTNEPDQSPGPKIKAGTKLYGGYYFDVYYPESFTAFPANDKEDYGRPYAETDEAFFTSPDGEVEFFIYSPLWSGEPENYTKIAENEKLVSEETKEYDEGDTRIRWVTIEDKDGSYTRSFVSKYEQISFSEIHHVFGIKYKNQAAYEKYKSAYLDFKNSLVQYADH
jgi:hypothetical protein